MKGSFKRFEVLPCIDGYEVVAVDTGRPVDHRDTRKEASGVAYNLNCAASAGPRALASALGCKEGAIHVD